MEQNIHDKYESFKRRHTKKWYNLRGWIERKAVFKKGLTTEELFGVIYKAAKGNELEILNIIAHLTDKTNPGGRTQYMNDNQVGTAMDVIRDESGEWHIVGYNPNAELRQKGQHQTDNPKIYRKDGQVKKNYITSREMRVEVMAALRKAMPELARYDKDEEEQVLEAVLRYADEHHIKTMNVVRYIKMGVLTVIFSGNQVTVKPKANEGRVIYINESVVEDLKMSEYKFTCNIKRFLRDLLLDPINAQPSELLKYKGLNRSKLLGYLKRTKIIELDQRISDTDNDGNPKTAVMKDKYRVPTKNLDRKIEKLYIRLFERNLPEPQHNNREEIIEEDGEGGAVCAGATTCGASSGQFTTKLFGPMRRKMPTSI